MTLIYRSHVWAEEKFVDRAADDFSETETMIQIAEVFLSKLVIYRIVLKTAFRVYQNVKY